MVILGIGQGGALGLGLILPVLRGRDPGQVAGMTAMSMGVGYLIAATGPALVGAIRDSTGDWTWPVIALLVMTVVQVPGGVESCDEIGTVPAHTRVVPFRQAGQA